jgi:curved DNA-binding protein
MEYKDYYKTLGIEKNFTKDELRKQYRILARKYHPDINTTDKNASSKFAEISEAYEVLSDDEKRKKYDELGSDWELHQATGQSDHFDWSKYATQENGQNRTREQNWEDFFGNAGKSGTSDFFRNLFGQGYRGTSGTVAQTGQDLHAELVITLEEAFSGGVRILTVGNQQIRLTLKPGIWDRQTIKIEGKGSPGFNNGKNGDLFITFLLQLHPEYRLDGINLYRDLPISIYAALLGTTQEAKTISGTYKIKIPQETQNGTVFKLKGRGFPIYDRPGSSGDLFLKAVIQLPEKLSEREKTLFGELAALRNEKVGGEKK